MPAMEVELKVKEPSRYGAPMMLVRDGDNRDLAAVVAMRGLGPMVGRVQLNSDDVLYWRSDVL